MDEQTQELARKVDGRKNKLILRELQLKFIVYVGGMGAVICLIAAFAMRTLSNVIADVVEFSDIPPETAGLIITHLNNVTIYFVVLVTVALVFAWTGALYLSNRIAGPIFSMTRTLDNFLDGDKTVRVKLRKKDFLQEFAAKINAVLEKSQN